MSLIIYCENVIDIAFLSWNDYSLFYLSWAKKIDPYISYIQKRGKVNKCSKSIDLWNIKKQKKNKKQKTLVYEIFIDNF